MNTKILLFAIFATVFASCNTAYKSGQTPDDVYFSPARVVEEDTKKEEQKDQATTESIEDREIRMKIRDRRWRDLNNDYECNCSCNYHPYKYGYSYGYYYNPYYYPYPVYLPNTKYINPKNTAIRTTSLGGYNAVTTKTVVNPKTGQTEYIKTDRTYNNSNRNTTREVLTPSGSSSNNRTYTPSTNTSSGNTSGGRSVSRPVRH
jgi:hypothetical protein